MGVGTESLELGGFGRGTRRQDSGACCGRRGFSWGGVRVRQNHHVAGQRQPGQTARCTASAAATEAWGLAAALVEQGAGITVFTPTPDFHVAGISSRVLVNYSAWKRD